VAQTVYNLTFFQKRLFRFRDMQYVTGTDGQTVTQPPTWRTSLHIYDCRRQDDSCVLLGIG